MAREKGERVEVRKEKENKTKCHCREIAFDNKIDLMGDSCEQISW